MVRCEPRRALAAGSRLSFSRRYVARIFGIAAVVLAPTLGGVTTTRAANPNPVAPPAFLDAWRCGTPQDCRFADGYIEHGGPAVHLQHLLEDVAPCEGGPDWSVANYDNGYVSRFQFNSGSWSTASKATGFKNANDPYEVGVNVAWWITHIKDPGSTEGWPTCWHM